ncbi:MAG: flagellar biosynthesis protein [Rubrivivax sp.]|nr:flagellar biosynthesis protein [Rubrivivax sp.]
MTTSSKAFRNAAPPASAGPARTVSPYSRFIPREELGAFAAWHPDTLNAELEPAAAAAPPAEAAAPPAQVAAARQAGYQDGYRDGLVALDSFKQSFAMQMTTQLGQLVQSFHTQIDALEQQMAQAVAQAAVMLARRVVRAEIHAHPEQVAELATQAVNAVLQSARQIRVLVHPEDHALVASGAAEALQSRGARLLPHPDVARGGCIVESDLGRIDASIDIRWREAAATLGSELPWHDDEAPRP